MKLSNYIKNTHRAIRLVFFCFLVLITSQLTAQTVTQNYLRVRIPRSIMQTNAKVDAMSSNKDSVQTIITYIDGLGRPLQTVTYQATPTGKDLVQPFGYDQYGRESIKYLPYASTTSDGSYKTDALQNGSGLSQFYKSPPTSIAENDLPFSVTNFEPSPMNRPVEQGAPGLPWQPISNSLAGHTIKTDYRINNTTTLSNDTANSTWVALYTATSNANQSRTLIRNGNYGAGQLTVTVTKNENWRSGRGGTIEEYKDKDERIVLKRTFNYANGSLQILSTYYVYDEFGLLAYVLPPGSNPDIATPSIPNSTCYIYRYDERNRQTQKKIPGKGWVFTVYNKLDQPVLTQDSVQRIANQWAVSKYDALGRVIMVGVWNAGSVIPLSTLQSNIYGVTQWDTRDYANNTTSYPSGYILGSYPIITKTLSVNYYDDYTNIPLVPAAFIISGNSTMIKGQLTATKTAVLNTIGNPNPDYLWKVIYYDNKGRNVKTFVQHYLGGTVSAFNYDEINNTYNINDQITTTTRLHRIKNAGNTATQLVVTVANQFIYDHEGRKIKTWEQITNAGQLSDFRTLICKVDYDELGQVWKKNLHSIDSVSFKITESYSYNERGWSLGKSSNLFVLLLQYNSGTTAQYNGNISGQAWLVAGNSPINYNYNYDQLNRLVAGNASDNNNENNITYDPSGNIKSLNRYANNTLIDQLTYTYPSNSVQLQSVNDATTSDAGLKHATTNYLYDGNGNLTSDDGKGITITYNMLNLPQAITAKNTTYSYDASGEKLGRLVGTAKTDYISGIQYDGTTSASAISFIQTEEGRAISNGPITYNYEYSLTDHLNNSRVNFDTGTGGPRKVQTDDYYPFGMEISRTVTGSKNEYLYNKKELQENIGFYDYGARFYDPIIAKWINVDPMAEKSRRWSPYNYCSNNPIIMIDPDGMKDVYFYDKTADKSGRSRTEYLINQGLGGNFAEINENTGLLSININKKQLNNLNEEQKAFYEVLKAGMDSESLEPTKINIVSNDKEAFIGSYDDSKIDLADVEHFGSGVSSTGADMFSVFGHEYTEQVAKQGLTSEGLQGDHKKGVAAEEKIKGVKRGPNDLSDLKDDKEGGQSGIFKISFTDDKTKKTVTLSIDVRQNNIQTISRN